MIGKPPTEPESEKPRLDVTLNVYPTGIASGKKDGDRAYPTQDGGYAFLRMYGGFSSDEDLGRLTRASNVHFSRTMSTLAVRNRLNGGVRENGLYNRDEVVTSVVRHATSVARNKLKGTLPFTLGGDHSAGLANIKGTLFARAVEALLQQDEKLSVDLSDPQKQGAYTHFEETVAKFKDSVDTLAGDETYTQLNQSVQNLVDEGVVQADDIREFLSDVHVLWFHAHPDFHTHETSASGNIHAMPARAIIGEGAEELTGIFGDYIVINPQNIHMVGIRDYEEEEIHAMAEAGVQWHKMELGSDGNSGQKLVGLAGVLAEIKQQVGNAPIILELDIDGLDARDVPATGTPVGPGSPRETPDSQAPGVLLEDAVDAFQGVTTNFNVQSIDVCEIVNDPEVDPQSRTMESALRLILSVLDVDIEEEAVLDRIIQTGQKRAQRIPSELESASLD